jgi:hypothetical protein
MLHCRRTNDSVYAEVPTLRPEILFLTVFFLIMYLIPIIVGFTWVRVDADRSGQPGILWAVLTIPFGWLSVLVYVALRAIGTSGVPR